MKKTAIIFITAINLASIGFASGIEELRNSSDINNIDKNSMEEIETRIPDVQPVKINAGDVSDFLCGLGIYSNCRQATAKTTAELEYIRNNLNKATEIAVEMLNKDFVPLGELDHRIWTQYYTKAVNRIKSTCDASSPSPEAFDLLVYINERTLWITESAAEQSINLSQLAKIIEEPFARIRNSAFASKSLKQIRSDVDIITSQFLNNGNVQAIQNKLQNKKINYCLFKELKGNTCVYKCKNGTIYEMPAQRPSPWNEDEQFVIPCPQLVFPF